MKIFRSTLRWFFLSGSIIIVSLLFLEWGSVGHPIINKAGARNFPDISILGPTIIQRLSDSASVPDWRQYGNKTYGYIKDPNEPNHFMDMDALAEFSTRSITHNRDSLFLIYGESYIRNTIGFLPWVIDSVMTVLTDQMRAKDWNKAWSTAGDLGHYIADAHQPLHATKKYDGDTIAYGKGSRGIHSRYESTMITNYQSSITLDSVAVHYISNPLDTAFSIMYESCSYTDSVLIADFNARQLTGGIINSTYYASLWQQLGFITKRQFQRSSVAYGSFLYTAWQNAGSPSTFVEQLSARVENFRLDQNFPNPFNPTTTIQFSIPPSPFYEKGERGGFVTLKVYDILGKEVVTLVNETKELGNYKVKLDATNLASGIYFYRMEAVSTEDAARKFVEAKKMILLR